MGQSWQNVLQHVRKNLNTLPSTSSQVLEFYTRQDNQQAINRIRRIIRIQLQAAASESNPVSGPMSEILTSKMRYAEKKTPEERYEAKLSHFAIDEESKESSLDELSDVQKQTGVHKDDGQKDKAKKRKRGKGKRKGKAEDAHVAMCNKAMATLNKVNKLFEKYDDSSSSSD